LHDPDTRQDRKLKQALTVALMAPVAICVVIGVVFLVNGDHNGLTLLGLGALMALFNAFVIRVVFRRVEQGVNKEKTK
jgi:uncharacterized membrane protein